MLNSTPTVYDEGAALLNLIADGEATADDLRVLEKLEDLAWQRDDLWKRLMQYIEMIEQTHDDDTTTESDN